MPEKKRPPLDQVYRVTHHILLTQARHGRAPLARRALMNPQSLLRSVLAMMQQAVVDY